MYGLYSREAYDGARTVDKIHARHFLTLVSIFLSFLVFCRSRFNQWIVPKNLYSQKSNTTFKQNLTWRSLSIRANLKCPMWDLIRFLVIFSLAGLPSTSNEMKIFHKIPMRFNNFLDSIVHLPACLIWLHDLIWPCCAFCRPVGKLLHFRFQHEIFTHCTFPCGKTNYEF